MDPAQPPGKKLAGRIPIRVVEERERVVELMLLRSAAHSTIYTYCEKTWGIVRQTADDYIRRVTDRWHQEWQRDPERLRLRTTAIKSLEHARLKAHEIINAVKTSTIRGPRGPIIKKFYVYDPNRRLQAMKVLTTIERELSKIGGYATPDVLIDAPNATIAVAPAGPAIGNENSTQLIGSPAGFAEYMRQLSHVDATIEAEVIEPTMKDATP